MEIKITGTSDEIEKLLNAIGSSKGQLDKIAADTSFLHERFKPMDPKVYRQMLLDALGKGRSNDDNSKKEN